MTQSNANSDSAAAGTTTQELERRLRILRRQVAKQETRSRRRCRQVKFGGWALVGVSVISLFSVTMTAFKLDAHALTQVGRLELEKQLPEGRASMATYLVAQAPSVIRQGVNSLMSFVPDLRRNLVGQVQSQLDDVTAGAERELFQRLADSVESIKINLDANFPNLSDREKTEKIVEIVSKDFVSNVDVMLDVIYGEYLHEIGRIESFLSDLSTYDDSILTPRQRTQKELIRTLLKLMVIEEGKSRQG